MQTSLYQVRVCQRLAVFSVRGQKPMDLAHGDLHAALPVHEAFRNELKVQPAALDK